MTRSGRLLRLVALIVLAGIGIDHGCTPKAHAQPPAESSDTDEAADVVEIRAALDRWLKAMVNVRYRYEVTYPERDATASDIVKTPKVKGTGQFDHIWTDRGQARNHKVWFQNDMVFYRALDGTDGERTFVTGYPVGDSSADRPKYVEMKPAGGLASDEIRAPLLGLWIEKTGQWLPEFLHDAVIQIQGYERIDGVRCPRLRVEKPPNVSATTMVLDPDHDFLPKLAMCTVFRNEVQEFRRFAPDLSFPWSGRFQSGENRSEWRMSEVAFNQEIDPKMFEPPIAVGTEVIDMFTGRRYVHGAKGDGQAIEANIVEEAKTNLNLLRDPISARPPQSHRLAWSAGLLGASLALIVAALWMARRRG